MWQGASNAASWIGQRLIGVPYSRRDCDDYIYISGDVSVLRA